MCSLLLALIYLAFISLGLPDSLLGTAWPVMRMEFGADLSLAGAVSMAISACTIVASLHSERLTHRFGTGLVTAVSTAMTAAALFGFSVNRSAALLFLWAIPYGLGAGAIDAALNNYVAVHFSARHMSWLHCFWGVGASISPYIMSACLVGSGWRTGYRTVSLIQLVLTLLLFAALPTWRRNRSPIEADSPSTKPLGVRGALQIPGVPLVLTAFGCYCAMEWTACLWAGSYLVEHRGLDVETAASSSALLFLGITVGRAVSGFVADRLGDRTLIRVGSGIALCGMVLLFLPTGGAILPAAALFVVGFGCAPIYPSIIHSTPVNFGAERAQAIIGVQMACAYIGSTFAPPIFGLLAEHISIGLYPVWLVAFTALMLIAAERLTWSKPT